MLQRNIKKKKKRRLYSYNPPAVLISLAINIILFPDTNVSNFEPFLLIYYIHSYYNRISKYYIVSINFNHKLQIELNHRNKGTATCSIR